MEIKKGNTKIDIKRKFHLLSSALPEALILIDYKGTIKYWNSAAERLFGFSAKEAFGKDLHQLIAPKGFYEDYKKGLEKFRLTGKGPMIKNSIEIVAIKKDGTEFPLEISLSPIKVKGLWHALAIVRDIRERKKSERRMHDTNRLLKMFTQNITRKEFLDTTVKLIKSHCGCSHTGIRLLNKKGGIPFESYDGYTGYFISCESPISIHRIASPKI